MAINDVIANSYDNLAFGYQQMRNRELSHVTRIIDNKIYEYSNHENIRSALDIGTGVGHGLFILRDKFPSSQILALDISKNMLDLAKKSFLTKFPNDNKINFACQDWMNFDISHRSKFELILSILCLHLSSDTILSIEKVTNQLTERGVFFISILGCDDIDYHFTHDFLPELIIKHNSNFEIKKIKDLFDFPAKNELENVLSKKHLKYSIQEYRQPFYIRTIEGFFGMLNTKLSIWQSFIPEAKLELAKWEIKKFFRKKCNKNGFEGFHHSYIITGKKLS